MKNHDRDLFLGKKSLLLNNKTITIVGLGSVGSTVTEMLAREDFSLRLIDRGRVEEKDMSRLNLFVEEDINRFKVKQAKKRIEEINPKAKVKSFHENLTKENIFLIKSDLVIDTSNQPETNELIFSYCQEQKLPLIYIRYSGSKVKVLVANKHLSKKTFHLLDDVGNVTEEGLISPTTMLGSMIILTRVFKFFMGDRGSYYIESDVMDEYYKKTKL